MARRDVALDHQAWNVLHVRVQRAADWVYTLRAAPRAVAGAEPPPLTLDWRHERGRHHDRSFGPHMNFADEEARWGPPERFDGAGAGAGLLELDLDFDGAGANDADQDWQEEEQALEPVEVASLAQELGWLDFDGLDYDRGDAEATEEEAQALLDLPPLDLPDQELDWLDFEPELARLSEELDYDRGDAGAAEAPAPALSLEEEAAARLARMQATIEAANARYSAGDTKPDGAGKSGKSE